MTDQSVLDAENKIREAKADLQKVLAELRKTCEHKVLLEAPWEASESGWFSPMQALRICEDCGVEEEGPHFRVLKGRVYHVRRHEVYRCRRGGLARFNSRGELVTNDDG